MDVAYEDFSWQLGPNERVSCPEQDGLLNRGAGKVHSDDSLLRESTQGSAATEAHHHGI